MTCLVHCCDNIKPIKASGDSSSSDCGKSVQLCWYIHGHKLPQNGTTLQSNFGTGICSMLTADINWSFLNAISSCVPFNTFLLRTNQILGFTHEHTLAILMNCVRISALVLGFSSFRISLTTEKLVCGSERTRRETRERQRKGVGGWGGRTRGGDWGRTKSGRRG